MSGNNPFGDQPGQPHDPQQPGQPNQPWQPGQPGPSFGGPSYSGPYNQPTPSGPYPPQQGSGPYGPGPGGPGAPGGPPGPYGGYQPGQPQPPKKSNKTPIIIGAAVLALVLIGTIVGVAVTRSNNDPTTTDPPGGTATSAPPAEAKLPSDAVRGFLEALATGDAQTALTYAQTAPGDTTFLTDEVLAESNKLAPITGIDVPEVNDEYAYSVDAAYKMGSQVVDAKFPVEKAGQVWKLREVAFDLDVSSRRSKTLPLVINGVTVEADSLRLFPGSYEFTTGNKNIDYGKSNVLTVQSPADYPRGISDIKPTLTSTGEKVFTSAVEDNIKSCVKSKKLKNPGCPNNLSKVSGGKPDDGTLKWTYNKDALDNMKVRLDYQNPAKAASSVYLGFKATAKCDGSPCRITQFGAPKPAANLLREPIKVVWER
ncbi:MAG: hypothetical protein L0H41_12855 [Microlunatus sp.]|nr:hypothetical protein [Microlunatus sp.]MDN5769547.1 hypothetical protein [Microlunatus sp.]